MCDIICSFCLFTILGVNVYSAAWMFPFTKPMTFLSSPVARPSHHKGMWREVKGLGGEYLEAGLQKVRSLSPSEEKHCSNMWSDTSSSVGGFHFGLWSLSINTVNRQKVTTWKMMSHQKESLCYFSRTYPLLHPHRSRSPSAKHRKNTGDDLKVWVVRETRATRCSFISSRLL